MRRFASIMIENQLIMLVIVGVAFRCIANAKTTKGTAANLPKVRISAKNNGDGIKLNIYC